MAAPLTVRRHPLNPIVRPGGLRWRRGVTFNPAVVRDDDGTFYMIERAAEKLRPFQCVFGLLRSADGIRWKHVSTEPILTATALGYPHGSIQDPRLVKLDEHFVLTGVVRPYACDCAPGSTGPPEYREVEYPGRDAREANHSRSFMATSQDLRRWNFVGYCSDPADDDRDNILFPEKIGGRHVLLRRPLNRCGPVHGTNAPGIWLSESDTLTAWSPPRLLAAPQANWESRKIGGSAPPIRTPAGWLVLYHGVDQGFVYRIGALLLDLEDPGRVLARTIEPMLEPATDYERKGVVIPNVIFPCGNVVVGDELWIYYGACDTAIALAMVNLQDLLANLRLTPQVSPLIACP